MSAALTYGAKRFDLAEPLAKRALQLAQRTEDEELINNINNINESIESKELDYLINRFFSRLIVFGLIAILVCVTGAVIGLAIGRDWDEVGGYIGLFIGIYIGFKKTDEVVNLLLPRKG